MRQKKTYTISSDMRRAFTSKGFLIGAVGLVLVIALSSLEGIINAARSTTPLQNGFHGQIVMTALSSNWVTLAIPILCALPFTAAFVDDIKSGFIKQYLHRTNIKQYIKAKIIACGLSGGLVLLAGIITAYFLSYLVFTPMEFALEVECGCPAVFCTASSHSRCSVVFRCILVAGRVYFCCADHE